MAERARAISVSGLHKRYGGTDAVCDLSLEVDRGEIFGLIGPDGAGKTTTFHILAGVLEPTAGRIDILGRNVRDSRTHVGYLTQQFSLYPDLSVDENIDYAAAIRRIPPAVAQPRKSRYRELMGLGPVADRLSRALSGGMKQKLALCCALVSAPEILLLDEPTTGVDPISRRELWDVLAALSADGVTIVVATPYLDEAERCHRIALMSGGRIEQRGTPAGLRSRLGLHRLEVRPQGALFTVEAALAANAETAGFADVQAFGDRLDVLVADPDRDEPRVRALLAAQNIALRSVERTEPTLENVFIADLRRHGSAAVRLAFPRTIYPDRGVRSDVAIEARALSKRFGTFSAVCDVDLAIRYGEIYGLLGANGAGKTTTIKMLCGLTGPSSGTLEIAGIEGGLRTPGSRARVGYMSQKFTLYNDLTIAENLQFYCGVYKVPAPLRLSKIDWALTSTGLQGHEHQLTRSLPGGWKQRLALGACVLHEPEILFLDEPTSGVDPLARREFWRLIDEFAKAGTAVLVTTHYLDEAEHCNRVGFMANGRLVTEGAPSDIKASQPGQLLELATDRPQIACELLKERLGHWRASLFGERLHVALYDPPSELPAVRTTLREHGIEVRTERQIPYSLEDAFINVVSRAEGS